MPTHSQVARFEKKYLHPVLKQYNISETHLQAVEYITYATKLIDSSDLELIKRDLEGIQKQSVAQYGQQF